MKAIFRGAKACNELHLYEEAITWCDDGLAIEKENKALLEVRSKSVDGQMKVKKGRPTDLKNKSNAVEDIEEKIYTSFTVDSLERDIQTCHQYLALSKESGNLTDDVAAYYTLGISYHKLGHLEKAIEFFRKYHAICKDTEDKLGEICACLDLAKTYQRTGDLTKAIEHYKVCLEHYKDKRDMIGEQAVCTNLGTLHHKLGEYKVAMDYCQRRLTICKELGDRAGEGRVNERIGLLHERLNDFKKAAEHFTIYMGICQEVGDQSGEMFACSYLGNICNKIGDFKQAKEYYEKCILIAKEVKDRDVEESASGNLGNLHTKMGNFNQAIKCLNRCLAISQTVGDRAMEADANCNLAHAYLGLGDLKAIGHFEKCLVINREIGDRAGEGRACGNLGIGFCSFGNYKLAKQYNSQYLTICKELGDRRREGLAYTNLGAVYHGFGNFKQAIEFHKESLTIFQELKDKAGEGRAFGNLGIAYESLSDFKQAAEYYNRSLMIFKGTGDIFEGVIYHSLGNTFLSLGYFKEARKYYNKHLEISKKVGDRAGEGGAYGGLGMVYQHLGDYEEAVNYHEQHLLIFKELGVRTAEGFGYRNLGNIHQYLGDFDQAKKCYNKLLAISKETGDRAGEGNACLRLSNVLRCLGDLQQAMEFSKQHLIICKETGDISGEGRAYLCQGYCLQDWGFPSDAVVLYQSSVQQFNHVRRLLQSKDEWKISLRNEYRMAYTVLWNVLLTLDRTEEALVAAEKGRAQALVDLLVSHYGFESLQHDQIQDQTATELLTHNASNTVFLAVDLDDNINVWLLQDGDDVQFSQQIFDTEVLKSNRGEDFGSFIKQTYKEIGVRSSDVKCEDRSLDALHRNDDLTVEDESDLLHLSLERHLRKTRVDAPDDKTVTRPPPVLKNSLNVLYDVIVAPVIPHLRGNELIIVPDGQLFLVPFAALQDAESRYMCESFRIRVIPSLTCLKLVTDVPLDHHCKSGALIVGDPWVQDIPKCSGKPKLVQLQFARKEAEMIGKIVKSPPLIGSEATKEEVLRRLNSVALIHIAAHGRIETGEIALAPNPSRTSKIPREEDFLLTMSDVLSVGLRARLVVLSCCYSGRGEIKDEGVVGIARAFLGAGARSVLVSLWAIDDEATLEFMRVFYQHLADGKTAGEALNRATNHMRESQDFNRIKLWAPFVLIGDDVTLECSDGN